MSNLKNLKKESMNLYFKYREGLITLDSYLQQIKPLDDAISSCEIQILKCHLGDSPVFEITSS